MINDLTMQDMIGMEPDDVMHVVMFYGPTCGPCKATMPHYEKVSEFFQERGANIKFHRIDAWNPPEQKHYCSERWGITGVPNFKIFCQGEAIYEKSGGGNFDSLHGMIHFAIDEAYKRFTLRY